MSRCSRAWANLETRAGDVLGGRRLPNTEWFKFIERPDVVVEDFGLIVDAKLRKAHRHHRLYHECKNHYCKEGQEPVIVTAEHNDRQPLVVVSLSFLAGLLDTIRKQRQSGSQSREVTA